MSETSEQTAERIAARGREALIARLRPAFEEAAAAHADVLQLSPEQIEEMIQRAADRADGLQWRRALAAVATEELGLTLGEALSHPDVIRAHEIVGAPSYEDSLAELSAPIRRPADATPAVSAAETPEPAAEASEPAAEASEPAAESPDAAPETPEPAEADAAADADPEAAGAVLPDPDVALPASEDGGVADDATETDDELAAPDAPAVAEPATDPGLDPAAALGPADSEAPLPGLDAPVPDGEPTPGEPPSDEPVAALDQPTVEYDVDEWEEDEYYEPDGLRMGVVHLGGIANLEPAEKDIELLMSEEGLDIIRGGHDVLGRLDWQHVRALEVPTPRSRRRRKPGVTHLVIRTARGDASFEVPEITPEELREHLAPVIAEHLHGL